MVKNKVLAVLEVLIILFAFIPLLTLGIYRILPGFELWQTEVLGFPFPVFGHVVMIGVALLAIAAGRRKLVDYGIIFKNAGYHLDIAATCFIPVVLSSIPFGLGVDYASWGGALILAAVKIGLLFALVLVLRKKPAAPGTGVVAIGILLLLPGCATAGVIAGKALALFLTYAFFVGFGEEIIYRGYMQSRLNEAFGKPYRFFGVAFGWGAIITSLVFGLTHVGILRWLLDATGAVTWAWGFWTFFGGLVYSFVREKSGSIFAPALLHGLPQAMAMVAIFLWQ